MSLLERVKTMLQRNTHSKPGKKSDYVAVDLSRAVQRNERASANARQALEDMLARNDKLKKDA